MTPVCSENGCNRPAVEVPVLLLPPLPDGPPLQLMVISLAVCSSHRAGRTSDWIKDTVSWGWVESNYADTWAKSGRGAPQPEIRLAEVEVTWQTMDDVPRAPWWERPDPSARN